MSGSEQALSIGSVLGGRSAWTSEWSSAIRALTLDIMKAREGVTALLNVNVVFHVPGHMLKPEFEGVRTGSFSKKHSLLMVQIALPERPPEDVAAYLRQRLLEGLNEAQRWADRKCTAADLSKLCKLV
jgi:hypothetical protein